MAKAAAASSSGTGNTSTSKSTGSSTSKGTSGSSAANQLNSAVSSGLSNTAGNGGSAVQVNAQGLGYYGNDEALSDYYDNLANLYNNDKATYNTTVYDRSSNAKSMAPNMGRDTSLAGKVAAKGEYAVYYDENGYATKAVKIGQGTSVEDLNNSGYYTGAQRTWADLTGNDLSQAYGQSDAGLYKGYTGVGITTGTTTGAAGAAAGTTTGAPAGAYGTDTDYSILIQRAIDSGADAGYVQQLLNARNAKITAAGGSLDQYANDAVSQAAARYITQANNSAYLNQLITALSGGTAGTGTTGTGAAALAGSGMSYENYLDSSGYNAAVDSITAANEAALAQLEAQAKLQSSQLNDSYDDAARQAYIAYMQSRRTLPQRMSASGMNGGLADSQQIALDAELQNNQATINTERQSALQEIQAALRSGQLSANQNYLGTLAGLQQNAASGYQSYAQQQQALQNENYWNEQNLALQKQQLANSLTQQDWENALALMQVMGYSDDQIAATLGIASGTQTDDASYRAAQLQLAALGL